MRRKRTVAVLSEHTLCRHGTADTLRRAGLQVDEYASSTQLVSGNSHEAIVLDLDHTRHDTPTLVATVVGLGTRVIALGALPRLAMAPPDVAPIVTPDVDLDALCDAARGQRTRPSRELARLRAAWSELTARLHDVMRLLASGQGNRAIGQAMGIGERTVKGYITKLMAAFDVDSRTGLALLAERAGLRPGRRTSL